MAWGMAVLSVCGIVKPLKHWIIAQEKQWLDAQLVTKIPQATIDYIKSLRCWKHPIFWFFERIVAW